MVKSGDWVRFYRNGGVLVIGVVHYRRPRQPWERADRIATDAGEVSEDSILEVRPPAAQPAPGVRGE